MARSKRKRKHLWILVCKGSKEPVEQWNGDFYVYKTRADAREDSLPDDIVKKVTFNW